jgi:hypothetical protein
MTRERAELFNIIDKEPNEGFGSEDESGADGGLGSELSGSSGSNDNSSVHTDHSSENEGIIAPMKRRVSERFNKMIERKEDPSEMSVWKLTSKIIRGKM